MPDKVDNPHGTGLPSGPHSEGAIDSGAFLPFRRMKYARVHTALNRVAGPPHALRSGTCA